MLHFLRALGLVALAPAGGGALRVRQDGGAALSPALQTCLEQTGVHLVLPASPEYGGDAFRSQNTLYAYRPAAIVLPASTADISAVVACLARERGRAKASTFGGGHGYASYALGGRDGFVVMDSQKLQNISVDAARKTVVVGAGVKIGSLAQKLGDHGFALPHGTCPSVGAVAHALGGGWGFSSRKWGWLLDHVVGLTLVDPRGQVTTLSPASAGPDADLWWALRGAGANNFGVVADVTFSVRDAPTESVYYRTVLPTPQDCAEALLMLQELGLKQGTPDALPTAFGAQLLLYGESGGDAGACAFSGQYLGPAAELGAIESQIVANMRSRGVTMPPFRTTVASSSWVDALTTVMGPLDAPPRKLPYYAQSLMDDGSPGYQPRTARAIADAVQNTLNLSAAARTSLSFDLNGPSAATNGRQPHGPAVWRDAGKRAALFLSQIYVSHYPPFSHPADQHAVNRAVDHVNRVVRAANPADDKEGAWGAYVNYVDPRQQNWAAAYYGPRHVVERLRRLKRSLDPHTLFDHPQGLAHAVVGQDP